MSNALEVILAAGLALALWIALAVLAWRLADTDHSGPRHRRTRRPRRAATPGTRTADPGRHRRH